MNQQSWDASVKGLTQFPDVLNQMATNLSWTSALGDAYFNIPQSVMNAVQVMRQRAQQSGNLKSTQQQNGDGAESGSGSGAASAGIVGRAADDRGRAATAADHHHSAGAARRRLCAHLQSDGRVRSAGAGLSGIFDRSTW